MVLVEFGAKIGMLLWTNLKQASDSTQNIRYLFSKKFFFVWMLKYEQLVYFKVYYT